MKDLLNLVKENVEGICCMDIKTARELKQIIPFGIAVRKVLELGVHKGVSSAYFAALISEGSDRNNLEDSCIEGMDIRSVSSATKLLQRLNFGIPVNFQELPYSYSFEIQKSLFSAEGQIFGRSFDLIYLDGSHQFEIDLSSLFIALNFLRPGGYLVIDDLKWSFYNSSLKRSRFVRRMSNYEKNVPHMSLIWELIKKDYSPLCNLLTINNGGIGIAQKINN